MTGWPEHNIEIKGHLGEICVQEWKEDQQGISYSTAQELKYWRHLREISIQEWKEDQQGSTTKN